MTDKRYQIFISSTFKDLQEERRAVQDAIISMGDFPVQMESFPATDESQMDFIQPLIEQSDYYILIIGGRYGSLDDDGLSFTHKEFRYAVEKGVPVLVMIHGKPENIAAGKSESTEIGRKKLKEFIDEAEHKRIRKGWETIGDLKLAVREALDHAKRAKPRTGWVRGDSIASFDTLEELNEVRKENEKYRDALGNLAADIPLPKMPAATDITTITLLPVIGGSGFKERKQGSSAKISGSWISFFPVFFSNLEISTSDNYGDLSWWVQFEGSCIGIGSAIAGELSWIDTTGFFRISRSTLNRLIAYYTAAGLMENNNMGDTPFTEAAQRMARRHHIAGGVSSFEISDGEISVTTIPLELDDNIPF